LKGERICGGGGAAGGGGGGMAPVSVNWLPWVFAGLGMLLVMLMGDRK
jgi:hypothetical protein